MNSSMMGLIEELFDTMDHPSALAALQQQVDKGDLDAMLFLGIYYMYIDPTWQPDRAFYYWDLAHEKHGVDHAALMRAIYHESKVFVYAGGEACSWVITMLSERAAAGVLLAARHLVWFAKVYRVGFPATEVLEGLKGFIQRASGKELLEARLLYVELLSLPYCSDTFDIDEAKRYWRRMITYYTSAEVAQRALAMHFRSRDGLLSESEIADLITRVEVSGQDISYYKGYWQLCNGDLDGAYRSFEKGYARGEYRCDIALAYCLWHGYGTGVNRLRALLLCHELTKSDDEAMLMKARFELTGNNDSCHLSLFDLEHEAYGFHKRSAMTEVILQRYQVWAKTNGSYMELRDALKLGLVNEIPLAMTFPYFFRGDYIEDYDEGPMGSAWLFNAEERGSHPLTDCLLALYHKGIEDKPMAAGYFLRVMYNPNVSLKLRKACARELVLEYARIEGGSYVDRVLTWWHNLDRSESEVEHQALLLFCEYMRSEVVDPVCMNSFNKLVELAKQPSEAEGFINYLLGLAYFFCESDYYDPEAVGRYWSRSAELGYDKAVERLMLQGRFSDWGVGLEIDQMDYYNLFEHVDSVTREEWLINEIAGYAFLNI